MIRLETASGWWLTTHPDHARLAAAFAEHWGNDLFAPPKPRRHVLKGIACHDDGWAARDAVPQVTREGKPSAFSSELVGKYSAFEEIDLAEYLAVRDRAVRLVAAANGYAALLVSMHTYNLLTDRADRATIAPEHLPLLEGFLAEQKALQDALFASIQVDPNLGVEERSWRCIEDGFHLLQAADNLSLLSCVDYDKPATLLRPLRRNDGSAEAIEVRRLGERLFRLTPYPFDTPSLELEFPSRRVEGRLFADGRALQEGYAAAEVTMIAVTVTS